MKKKLGFTLIELLAVIILLSMVLVIAVPSVNKYLRNSKDNASELQINTMLEAVETFANSYRKVLPENHGEQIRITLGQLKAEGLIKNDITDPRNDSYFVDSIEFIIRKNGNNYIYSVDENTIKTRATKGNSPTIILNGDAVEYYKVGDTYNEPGYMAYAYSGEEIADIVVDATELTLATAGIFRIKYVATDNNGISTTVIRNIVVK